MTAKRTEARVMVDYENNSEAWWNAAREAIKRCADTSVREVFRAIDGDDDEWTGPQHKAERFLAWAQGLPGWYDGAAHAPSPVLVQIQRHAR